MVLVALVGLTLAFCGSAADGKIVAPGTDDSSMLQCDVCQSALSFEVAAAPSLSHTIAHPSTSSSSTPSTAEQCRQFVGTASQACSQASPSISAEQQIQCFKSLAMNCGHLVNELKFDQAPTAHTCAHLGAVGDACANAAATPEFAARATELMMNYQQQQQQGEGVSDAPPNYVKVGADTAATLMLDVPPRYMWGWGPGLSGIRHRLVGILS